MPELDDQSIAGEDTVVGTVRLEPVAAGSKSAQRTVTLHTDERVWLLRRTDGPRWGVDTSLEQLEGQRIRGVGHKGTGSFLLTSWETADD